ncbi:hypothetical protein ABZ128_13465 [Streptomyces sp. NPDC006326]|uniref:hypothetical protein n=1 Tax=Streptomyces sp. NPDC006326 TaxID=3156752 RepID=UPI0033A2CC53
MAKAHAAGSASMPPTSAPDAESSTTRAYVSGSGARLWSITDGRARQEPSGLSGSASRITGSSEAVSAWVASRITMPSGSCGALTGMMSPGCIPDRSAVIGAAYERSPITFPEYICFVSLRAGFPDRRAPLRAPFRFPTAFTHDDAKLATAVLGSYTANYEILREGVNGVQARIIITNGMTVSSFAHAKTGYGTPADEFLQKNVDHVGVLGRGGRP